MNAETVNGWLVIACAVFGAGMLMLLALVIQNRTRRNALQRKAFIQGMDKCREVYQTYGEWPTLPGRVELANDVWPD